MSGLVSIEADRCVHSRIETASCRACEEVCPRRAWRLDDDGLNLSETDCDGCGLCVAVCPTRALGRPAWAPARHYVGGQDVLMAACDKAVAPGEEGHLPCLHAIDYHELLRHWQRDERIWLVATTDCDTCDRGRGERLAGRMDKLNTLFQARGRSRILLKAVPADQWRRLRTLGTGDSGRARESRRRFFSRLVQRPVPALAGTPAADEDAIRRAPGEYLSGHGPLPWVLSIDPAACVACHACVKVCPTQALRLEGGALEAPRGASVSHAVFYRLEHARCVGCGLCNDVCEPAAIEPRAWARPEQDFVLLHESMCRACGVRFQVPATRAGEAHTCWVCSGGRVRPRLYQVLEPADEADLAERPA